MRKTGALVEAAKVARQGLAAHPDSVPGLLTLSRILVDQGDREAGRDAVRAALAVDPGHPGALQWFARLPAPADAVSAEARDQDVTIPPEQAVTDAHQPPPPPVTGDAIDEALGDDPGELLYTDGDDADAAPPDHDDASSLLYTESLAMVYRRQGHLDRAVEVLDALFARDPANASLGEQRDAARAERDARKPRPYDVRQSGGQSMAQWLAAVAAVKVVRPPGTSSLDAFYQAPNPSVTEASDLAAFQEWLKELER